MSYNTTNAPLDCNLKLSSKEGVMLAGPTYYRKLIGKLNCLTHTRMDIAYSVQHLSQLLQTPREPHLKATFHVLRYLKGDPSQGLFLSKNKDCRMSATCDSCPDSRKSTSGYIVFMGDSPIG